jgi:hypothetical protein
MVGEFGGFYGDALAGRLVHHVQSHHQGPLQAHELQGQLQTPAQERGVDDVDNDLRLFLKEVISGLQFCLIGGSEGIDPGQVHAGELPPCQNHLAYRVVDSGAGKIGDIGLVAAEIIEYRTFAAIGLADEGNDHGWPFRR